MTTPPTTSHRPEISNLNGLRGLAMVPVLATHASHGIIPGGYFGVDLFFVLSGFLITWSLLLELKTTATIGFKNFYIRRALRLLPAGIGSLVLAAILWHWTKTPESDLLIASAAVLFYFANLVHPPILGSLTPAWSLSIEEQFYLIWPIALLGLYKLLGADRRKLIIFLSIIVLGVGITRAAVFHYTGYEYDLYRGTIYRFDGLITGAITAIIFTSSPSLKLPFSRAIVEVSPWIFGIGVLTVQIFHPALYYGGFTIIALVAGFLVFALAKVPPNWLYAHPIIVWIGKRSYGIYIYHMPIFQIVGHFRYVDNKFNIIIVTFLRLALTFLLADLSYRYYEKWFMARKMRYDPLPVGTPPNSQTSNPSSAKAS